MEYVKIYPNKITIQSNKEIEIEVTDIVAYLFFPIKIEEGVLFKHIFDIAIKNKKLFKIIFNSALGGFDFDMYIDEYNKKDIEPNFDHITYLEVTHGTDVFNFKGDREIHHFPDFHGIKENYTNPNFSNAKVKPCDMRIGIFFTPIYELKNYPIKINEKISYIEYNSNNKKRKMLTKLKGIQQIRVVDFFYAIFHEISWHGTPENRDELIQHLDDVATKIENGTEPLYKIKKDKDGYFYFEDEDGNIEYLNNDNY